MATDGITFLGVSGALTASAANTTRYIPITGRQFVESSTESVVEVIFREPGILQNLIAKITANTLDSGTAVYRTRKNAANGNQSISVNSGATGTFEDTTNTDTVSAADKLNYQSVIGGSTGSVTIITLSCLYAATDITASRFSVNNFNGVAFSTASTTVYTLLSGSLTFVATESTIQTRIGKAVTSQNLAIQISANTRTTTSTVAIRKNGANGNQSISISASSTGWFEDTTNTDSLAAADLYNYTVTNGTGAGTLTVIQILSSLVSSTTRDGVSAFGAGLGASINAGQTDPWSPLPGIVSSTALSESNAQIKARRRFRFSDLSINVSANTVTADSTLRMRINGSNGNLAASITASTTGIFTDTSNSDTLASQDDLINVALIAGGTGTSMTYIKISISTFNLFNFARSVSETNTEIQDSVTKKATFMRTVSETTTEIIGAVVRVYKAVRSTSANFTIEHAVAEASKFYRSVSESFTIADAVAEASKFYRSVSESLTIEGVVAHLRRVPVLVSESLQVNDVAARLGKVSRPISDSFTVTDAVEGVILEKFAVSVSESLTIISSTIRKSCRILPFLHS